MQCHNTSNDLEARHPHNRAEIRVQQGYPFSSVGVDYAGPLMIRYYAVYTQTSLAHTLRGKQYIHIMQWKGMGMAIHLLRH